MEVSASEWKKKAKENITKYLHRGGHCKGDEPQYLGGSGLMNTIGIAMGLPMSDPSTWSAADMAKAEKNEFVYFEGDSRKVIDVIVNEIISCCDGDNYNYITVLPIELFYQGKLYELPLFKVYRYKDKPPSYVDNIGRSYSSFDDWEFSNKLPPCEVGYPYKLQLQLEYNCKTALVTFGDTSANWVGPQVVKCVDVTAAVTGIGASTALIFVSGGLAAPFVAASLGAAVWGTARTGYNLIDKAAHGEALNPFTDSGARMLWLGLAANLISFGAMGASMRLATLASRGSEISSAFKLFVNIANGTSVTMSGLAILDTTIYLTNHHEDLSAFDILMHTASVAFWTKGLFTYKTAGTIVEEAQSFAFSQFMSELDAQQAADMQKIRNIWQNDADLLRKFHAAAKQGISPKNYSLLLIDAEKIMANLDQRQTEVFMNIRQVFKDDINLITGLRNVAARLDITPSEAAEKIVGFWQKAQQFRPPSELDFKITDGQLVVGRAPPINIADLPQLSRPMVGFLSQHLSQVDLAISHQWASSIPILVKLDSRGLFTCSVTSIVSRGRANMLLNGQLEISIHKLYSLPTPECVAIFQEIKNLSPSMSYDDLSKTVVKLCITKHRLRLECQRKEGLQWMKDSAKHCGSLTRLLNGDLKNNERDRLVTFRDTLTLSNAKYTGKMMTFIAELNPKNVSELVAYGEFVVRFVEKEKVNIQSRLAGNMPTMKRGVRQADWLREQAAEAVFKNTAGMKLKFEQMRALAIANDMIGVETVATDLSDTGLIAAIKQKRIKFGSETSAAYHIFKHDNIQNVGDYVNLANETIRAESGQATVIITQDGDTRLVNFRCDTGTCTVLEREGRVLLCTFQPLNHKSK